MDTNEEYSRLMDLPKHFLMDNIQLPEPGEESVLPVGAINSPETFAVDLSRKCTIILTRKKYQERSTPSNEILLRLEIDSKPHMNPDGKIISKDHIHIFREGSGLSWAYELSEFHDILFKNPNNFNSIFYDFCDYCNIQYDKTAIQGVI